MDVSVIIVTYNTLQMTRECIESVIAKTSGIDYEIILVDNASRDGSKEFFPNFDRIKYIYCEKNLGFGKANNIGFKNATGKYLFCLNSDTILLNNALKIFFNYAENDMQKAIYGCNLLDRNRNEIMWNTDEFHSVHQRLWLECKWMLGLNKTKKCKVKKPPYLVDYIVGAAMFIPAKYINTYGGFDERFFMYCEETDLQLRFSKHNISRLIIPGPRIIHLEGKSGNKSTFIKLTSMKSHFIYYKKNASTIDYYYFRVLYFLINIIKLIFKNCSKSEKKLILKNIMMKIDLNEMAEERDS